MMYFNKLAFETALIPKKTFCVCKDSWENKSMTALRGLFIEYSGLDSVALNYYQMI